MSIVINEKSGLAIFKKLKEMKNIRLNYRQS